VRGLKCFRRYPVMPGVVSKNLDKITGVVKRESEVLATKLKSKRRHIFEYTQR